MTVLQDLSYDKCKLQLSVSLLSESRWKILDVQFMKIHTEISSKRQPIFRTSKHFNSELIYIDNHLTDLL